MENNKPTYNKGSWKDTSPGSAIICYLLIQFVLASFILLGVGAIVASSLKVDFNTMHDYMAGLIKDVSPDIINASNISQGIANFIIYFLGIIAVTFFTRGFLKEDFNDILENKKFFSIYIPIMMVVFCFVSFLASGLAGSLRPSSNNQQSIEGILFSSARIPMIIGIVIFAPIVEELVYRKCIFKYMNKYGVWVSYLVSVVLFTLPHMLTTRGDMLTWLIQASPYVISAVMLCGIYHKSNYNIYTTIMCHLANNLMALVLTYLQASLV